MNKKALNPFQLAQMKFDQIADLLDLESGLRELLRNPLREYQFSIPVKMDDGSVKIFRGFRVQHNDARGSCTGGIRFHPDEDIDDSKAMAMWMSWKCAVADIPLGGAGGGVKCSPHDLGIWDQEQICRGYIRQLAKNIGPSNDIPAPDIMTNPQHMLWMLDEYEAIRGGKYPGFITGKPVNLGGSLGKKESTGFGLICALREALKIINISPQNTKASVQGFGKVAQSAINYFLQIGGTVTCVACWDQEDQTPYSFRKGEGIEFEKLLSITDTFGGIDKNKACDLGYEVLDGAAWMEQDVDILIPAAFEHQINEKNVSKISKVVKIIAEGANAPITPSGDEMIAERNIFMIPDFLANAGGVICSYYEHVQSNANDYWEKDEVLAKLDIKMTSAFIAVNETAKRRELSMRDAAYVIGVAKVAQACRDRGWA